MVFRILTISSCLLLSAFFVSAQEKNRALTPEQLVDWQRVTQSSISNNGKFVAVKHEPWQGDATVLLFNRSGKELARIIPAGFVKFSTSSDYLLVEKKTPLAEIEALKLKKTKKDKMPLDKLVLVSMDGRQEVLDSIRKSKLSEVSDWMAFHQGDKKDSTLYVRSLDGKMNDSIPAVMDYGFAKEGDVMYFITGGDSLGTKAGLYVYQPKMPKQRLIKEGKGNFKQIAFNKPGDKLTFLYADTLSKDSADSKENKYALYLSVTCDPAKRIVEAGNEAIPEKWIISENGDLRFSENGEFLFFGTSPEPRQRDTTVLDENRPNVQVWSWNESVQYTQQTVDKKENERKTYTAAYHLSSGKVSQLSTLELPYLQLPENGTLALASTSDPYGTERMWTGKSKQDIYIVDIQTGTRTPLLQASEARVRISPAGKYGFWYSAPDSSWFTVDLNSQKIYRLTTPDTFAAWDTDNDVPDYPGSYGSAGWSKDDKSLLLYDRNDIWSFDPTGAGSPINLTVNGKKESLRYQLRPVDKDIKYVKLDEPQLLIGFNEKTKASGFYSANLKKAGIPKALLTSEFKVGFKEKAKDSDAIIYTTETFERYPEIMYSNLRFQNPVQLTSLGNQQDSILWGTAELTSWTSLDGKVLEGVIYKPANFNPNKKYPLIVNFYERNSETLYNYRTPEPHRSTVDYRLYNSNEYIIFNPDIRYEDGYPGESCFNSVMPGIASLIAKGYINEKAIAAQGHSWGGYQVAYLATRTNLFAAIESGAPVVNMFSAYGGIRWGTGLNRSFQYEHGQSRIDGTPWDAPLRYETNSPLFTMDKVNTPILIMHNDADGHVPWYQGIEYFVALKRLQKPVWLLNYTGEPHWPMRMANRIDFQKRMFQFFNHYLKGEAMPKWMKEGVKAVDQPYELGY
ncbi:prolyl oligopeptidase family serine peptidase [Massilibacteroides sp.]|uniref:S9 family peptidase n=1 Tax=Massilibacteroides sp. TaxID=2034766 RepID=UPI002612116D|nr:prolyl oligopeptidase family serine peptidase [Massilibacteroides sp.]MDD4514208.1 prolyl oligopeptidase family serine peptidase [Massilibacteroides sp.]